MVSVAQVYSSISSHQAADSLIQIAQLAANELLQLRTEAAASIRKSAYYSPPILRTSTTYSVLLTTYYLLPTTYYLLPTTYYLLLTTHYSLLRRAGSLLTTHYVC